MAAPGADWRNPADGCRTGTVEPPCSVRSETGWGPTVPTPETDGTGAAAVWTFVGNPGTDNGSVATNTVEANDDPTATPPAIGARPRSDTTTECPVPDRHGDNGSGPTVRTGRDFDGSISLRRFLYTPGARRGAVVVG